MLIPYRLYQLLLVIAVAVVLGGLVALASLALSALGNYEEDAPIAVLGWLLVVVISTAIIVAAILMVVVRVARTLNRTLVSHVPGWVGLVRPQHQRPATSQPTIQDVRKPRETGPEVEPPVMAEPDSPGVPAGFPPMDTEVQQPTASEPALLDVREALDRNDQHLSELKQGLLEGLTDTSEAASNASSTNETLSSTNEGLFNVAVNEMAEMRHDMGTLQHLFKRIENREPAPDFPDGKTALENPDEHTEVLNGITEASKSRLADMRERATEIGQIDLRTILDAIEFPADYGALTFLNKLLDDITETHLSEDHVAQAEADPENLING